MPSVASDMTHLHKTEGTKKCCITVKIFLLIPFLLWFTTSTAMWMQRSACGGRPYTGICGSKLKKNRFSRNLSTYSELGSSENIFR